ncbi:hypothetical protein NLI96_g1070 [Meripilus lineatus]|uniref:NADP-dependent oxidoreductase domain-containing protein n=1 Tax=Meripilus lineatus TaxID=2056292 RepID=A0AAD5YNA1_9APHY|nr:hypothetical protein NLI96_g1070 [Physisporinus lineatus]
MGSFNINSTVRLTSGYNLPLLGFGVYQNYTTKESTLEAFKAGYRHVDSAQAYRNEAHVGAAFRESGLRREDSIIDLFLIHDPFSGKERRLATYRALQEAKQAGKIRSVGVSNYGVKHLEEIREAGYETPTVNQIEYTRDPAHILLRWSLQKGYVPLPKSATPSRIHSNTQIYDFELDQEDMRRLDALDEGKAGAISWNPVDAD